MGRAVVVQPQPATALVDSYPGEVRARYEPELAFRIAGKVSKRMVDVGDRVTANQVLARLDPKDLQTNVDSAQAQVVAEQARVTQMAAAFVRQEKLLPKGYTSQSEYDSAKAALLSSKSALVAAQAQLANARDQLSYAALVADGVAPQASSSRAGPWAWASGRPCSRALARYCANGRACAGKGSLRWA